MPETAPKVTLLSHTAQPEKLVAAAARICYSAADAETILEGLTEQKTADLLKMLAEMGHESPVEHASFTFAIEGVSRSLLAQITRHRIASFSVQSQRYVGERHFDYILPPAIGQNPQAAALFHQAMEQSQQVYNQLTDLLIEQHRAALEAQGVPAEQAKKDARKKAQEDARFVLPNACATKMMVTMNTRSLRNFFRLRCCNRAQWEIRQVAWQMLKLCRQAAPYLFEQAGPACLSGPCPEGKMSCGQAQQVRETYQREICGSWAE